RCPRVAPVPGFGGFGFGTRAGILGGGALGRIARYLLFVLLLFGFLPRTGTFASTGRTGQPRHAGHTRIGHAPAFRHFLHHLARLEKTVDELIDFADLAPRAGGDTRAAWTVDDLGVVAFGGSHRTDDCLDAPDLGVIEVGQLLLILIHARQHAHDLVHRAHLGHGFHLLEEVIERK